MVKKLLHLLMALLCFRTANAAPSHSKINPKMQPQKFNDKGFFECTTYFTIKESGCYNWTSATDLITVSGSSIWVNHLFNLCVINEGMGKLLSPVFIGSVSCSYIGCENGVYTAYNFPVGSSPNIQLKKGVSCAADIKASDGSPLRYGSKVVIWKQGSTSIFDTFGTYLFKVDDCGHAINYNHFDLYWGDDDPLGGTPGTTAAIPANCPYSTEQGNRMCISK